MNRSSREFFCSSAQCSSDIEEIEFLDPQTIGKDNTMKLSETNELKKDIDGNSKDINVEDNFYKNEQLQYNEFISPPSTEFETANNSDVEMFNQESMEVTSSGNEIQQPKEHQKNSNSYNSKSLKPVTKGIINVDEKDISYNDHKSMKEEKNSESKNVINLKSVQELEDNTGFRFNKIDSKRSSHVRSNDGQRKVKRLRIDLIDISDDDERVINSQDLSPASKEIKSKLYSNDPKDEKHNITREVHEQKVPKIVSKESSFMIPSKKNSETLATKIDLQGQPIQISKDCSIPIERISCHGPSITDYTEGNLTFHRSESNNGQHDGSGDDERKLKIERVETVLHNSDENRKSNISTSDDMGSLKSYKLGRKRKKWSRYLDIEATDDDDDDDDDDEEEEDYDSITNTEFTEDDFIEDDLPEDDLPEDDLTENHFTEYDSIENDYDTNYYYEDSDDGDTAEEKYDAYPSTQNKTEFVKVKSESIIFEDQLLPDIEIEPKEIQQMEDVTKSVKYWFSKLGLLTYVTSSVETLKTTDGKQGKNFQFQIRIWPVGSSIEEGETQKTPQLLSKAIIDAMIDSTTALNIKMKNPADVEGVLQDNIVESESNNDLMPPTTTMKKLMNAATVGINISLDNGTYRIYQPSGANDVPRAVTKHNKGDRYCKSSHEQFEQSMSLKCPVSAIRKTCRRSRTKPYVSQQLS